MANKQLTLNKTCFKKKEVEDQKPLFCQQAREVEPNTRIKYRINKNQNHKP